MNASGLLRIATRVIVTLAAMCVLAACAATNSRVVDHSFGFNVATDSPGIELLDYRYGDSQFPGASNPEILRRKGVAPLRANTSGRMRQGDSLYAKWRVKSTGEVYEDTVDLRTRLPEDIRGHKVYFMIQGAQLFVYLIPPESKKRPVGASPVGPRMYGDLDVKTIYPNQARP